MEIRGYSSWNDSIIGLRPSYATREEIQTLSENHLVVRVQDQDPNLRKLDDYLNGKVPEQGNNIAEMMHKMIF